MTSEQKISILNDRFDMLEKRIGKLEKDQMKRLSDERFNKRYREKPDLEGDKVAISQVLRESEHDPNTQAKVEALKVSERA